MTTSTKNAKKTEKAQNLNKAYTRRIVKKKVAETEHRCL